MVVKKKKHVPPTKRTRGDIAHAATRGALGAIPLAGAAASELLSLVLASPLEKRRDEWMESVGAALRRLDEQQRINLDDLQNDDAFIDIVLQASREALANSKKEKLDVLRNAVLNTACGVTLDESLQQMFLSLAERMTFWHLRILKLFHDPMEWYAKNEMRPPGFQIGSLEQVLTTAFPELQGMRNFYDQVWKDLHVFGLVTTEGLHTTMTADGAMSQRTSEMGNQFVKFITSPFPDE